jgi:hypothetical protein
MSEPEITRLTITWSKTTDLALRSHLGALGLKRGSLSKFIEDAVKWRLLDQTVSEVRKPFSDVPVDELHDMIEIAVKSIRNKKRQGRRSRSKR